MAVTAPGDMERVRTLIQVARGKWPADLVLTNARIANVFSNEVYEGEVAIYDGTIAGLGPAGSYRGVVMENMGGSLVLPGFIEHTRISRAPC